MLTIPWTFWDLSRFTGVYLVSEVFQTKVAHFCQVPQKEVGKGSSITFFSFGHLLATFADASVTYFVTFLPDFFCRDSFCYRVPQKPTKGKKRRKFMRTSGENFRKTPTKPRSSGELFYALFFLSAFVENIPVTTTTKIFSKVLRYKWEASCNTNGRRTAIQMGGVLRYKLEKY